MDKISQPLFLKPKLFPLPHKDDENAEQFYRDMEIDVLARTIWGEARGEGSIGMQAVACVVLNRVAVSRRFGGYWWGNSIIQVCQKPFQFSCWNKDDANYKKVVSITEDDVHFATAKRIARRAILGFVSDPTYGATHYHTRLINPKWAKGQRPSTILGQHVFYNLIEGV